MTNNANATFSLTPDEPPRVNRNRKYELGMYRTIVREFLASGQESCLVTIDGKTPKAICSGISWAIAQEDYPPVKAMRRVNSAYIVRR